MNIKELQELYFEKFAVLKTFCEDNGLTFYPVGGTLLGIVCFGGFIPWDDDLDLAMPRADYESLFTMRDSLREHGLIIERYKCSRSFPYPYTKILFANCVSSHIYDESFGFDSDIVPAIDLYPIDAVGNSKEEAEKKIHRVNIAKKFYEVKMSPINQVKNPIKRVLALIIHLIPMKCILASYDHRMAESAGGGLVTRWRGQDYEKHIYERSLWFETVSLSFNSLSVVCPAGYDGILRDVYGDYTKPYIFHGGMRHSADKNNLTKKYYEHLKAGSLDE